MFQLKRYGSWPLARDWLDEMLFARDEIGEKRASVLRVRVDEASIHRIDRRLKAVAESRVHDVGVGHAAARIRRARKRPRPVVLRAAEDPVRLAVVDRDVVELADRQVVDVVPGLRAVVREVHAAVVAEHDVLGLAWIDPHRVVVGMRVRATESDRNVLPPSFETNSAVASSHTRLGFFVSTRIWLK